MMISMISIPWPFVLGALSLVALVARSIINTLRNHIKRLQIADDMVSPTHWLLCQNDPRIHFNKSYDGRFVCILACTDGKGNSVESRRFESTESATDAFQKAMLEIEKTIGREWRSYQPGVREIQKGA